MTRSINAAADRANARRGERRATGLVLLAFGLSTLAGFGLLVVYALGGETQVEGVLLTLCLGGIGVGIVIWGQRLMESRIHIEERHPVGHVARLILLAHHGIDEEQLSHRGGPSREAWQPSQGTCRAGPS